MLGILHIRLKVVYTLYIVPTGLAGLAGFLSIDIMSLTGQSVNRQMKDAGFLIRRGFIFYIDKKLLLFLFADSKL